MSFLTDSHRLKLAVAVLVLASPSPLKAQVEEGWVSSRVAEWYVSTVRSAPGQWGIAIADQSGQMLWSMNPDQSLMPASAVKLFTTGYARSVLGGTARRATRVVGAGVIDTVRGEWLGNWALELNGDPSLERAEGSGPTLYDLAFQLAGCRGQAFVGSAQGSERQRARRCRVPGSLVAKARRTAVCSAGRAAHRP